EEVSLPVERDGLEKVLRGLVERGDMDMQSGVMREALREPRLLRVLMRGVGRMALGELRGLFNV
ncbi:MAG: hypothetical protein ACE5OO_00675, partial [Candidatus Bathyarchaeia archaeon]